MTQAGARDRRPAKPARPRLRSVTVAGRTVVTRGLRQSFWADLYSNAMTIGWGAFMACALVVFVLVNMLFALLFILGTQPVSNVGPAEQVLLLFFFSIETLATVGYGDMHPQTTYGHMVASFEMFCGLFLSALLTGLIFARFARPRARFVFADVLTIAPHEGCPTLVVRVANGRQNMITDARAKLWMIRKRLNKEGVTYRGFEELALEKAENPIFVLSWSLFHALDERSPLHGMTAADMERSEVSLLLALTGTDAATAQQVQGRSDYRLEQFRWNHRYVDILGQTPTGEPFVDYADFHEVVPLDPSAVADQLASASIAS